MFSETGDFFCTNMILTDLYYCLVFWSFCRVHFFVQILILCTVSQQQSLANLSDVNSVSALFLTCRISDQRNLLKRKRNVSLCFFLEFTAGLPSSLPRMGRGKESSFAARKGEEFVAHKCSRHWRQTFRDRRQKSRAASNSNVYWMARAQNLVKQVGPWSQALDALSVISKSSHDGRSNWINSTADPGTLTTFKDILRSNASTTCIFPDSC